MFDSLGVQSINNTTLIIIQYNLAYSSLALLTAIKGNYYEYALTLMVALLALMVQGGGAISMDKVLSKNLG